MADISKLELGFHQRMRHVYEQARNECDYKATRFLQLVEQQGGLAAAKQLLTAGGYSEGLTRLWEEGRLDISMEATLLREPWRSLFTEDELAIATRKLNELGYQPKDE